MRARFLPHFVACAIGGACGDSDASFEFREIPAEALAIPYPGVEFTAIRDVVATSDAIWVLDGSPPFLTRIARPAGPVLRGGDRGEGPADFVFPVALQVDAERRSAHVWDFGSREHKVFDAAISLIGSERLRGAAWAWRRDFDDVSYASPYRVRLGADGTIAVASPIRLDVTADFRTASLVHADGALGTRRQTVVFADHMESQREEPGEFAAVPLWDACGSDLVVWRPASHDVAWIEDGAVTASVAIPGRPARIRMTDISAYLERMIRLELGPNYPDAGIDFDVMARSARSQFADHLPFVTSVLCRTGGTAWLRLFDNRTDPLGHGRRWLRISRDGAVEAIEFPPLFEPLTATARGVLGSLQFPDGVQWLAEWPT